MIFVDQREISFESVKLLGKVSRVYASLSFFGGQSIRRSCGRAELTSDGQMLLEIDAFICDRQQRPLSGRTLQLLKN